MLARLTQRRPRTEPLEPSATDEGLQPNPELKLPGLTSLTTIIFANVLLQISFFIIVASSNEYAIHLGGDSTFSGIVIGIPTVVSGLALIPLVRYDKGGYTIPLHVCCASSILGHVLYALAYRFSYLYLILIGRMVSGLSFTMFMYAKRYCTDPRFVGIRRRTTLASWLVIGQGIGLTAGPFAGGLLYKVGFQSSEQGQYWNGFTSPAWIMAGIWVLFWVHTTLFYEDPPHVVELVELDELSRTPSSDSKVDVTSTVAATSTATDITPAPVSYSAPPEQCHIMTKTMWGTVATMCWFAMLCFFILGAWESNLPVYGASSDFHWSPFQAGNFIALGGITSFPFLLANLFLARRVQDRHLLAFGTSLGLAGLIVFLAILKADEVTYGGLFASWWSVALGFNLASTVTLSLLSKQLPGEWNGRTSMAIQYSNYAGRVSGAIWGGSGVKVGLLNYVGLEIALVGVGGVMFSVLWKGLKAKRG